MNPPRTVTSDQQQPLLALPSGLEERCQRAYGWSQSFCHRAVHQGYRPFLQLKRVMQDWQATQLSPSVVIDQVWHQHILQVEHYVQACHDYTGGRLVGHNPDGGLDRAAHRERIQATKVVFKAIFQKDVDETDPVWKFPNTHDDDDQPDVVESSIHRRPYDDDDNHNRKRKSKRRRPKEGINRNNNNNNNNNDTILLLFRGQYKNQEETLMKVGRNVKMSSVFDIYATRQGVQSSSLRFMLDRERINPSQTPKTLELDDLDEIEVLLEQTGC